MPSTAPITTTATVSCVLSPTINDPNLQTPAGAYRQCFKCGYKWWSYYPAYYPWTGACQYCHQEGFVRVLGVNVGMIYSALPSPAFVNRQGLVVNVIPVSVMTPTYSKVQQTTPVPTPIYTNLPTPASSVHVLKTPVSKNQNHFFFPTLDTVKNFQKNTETPEFVKSMIETKEEEGVDKMFENLDIAEKTEPRRRQYSEVLSSSGYNTVLSSSPETLPIEKDIIPHNPHKKRFPEKNDKIPDAEHKDSYNPDKPWMNKRIRKAIDKRQEAYIQQKTIEQSIINLDEEMTSEKDHLQVELEKARTLYKKRRNLVVTLTRLAKKNYDERSARKERKDKK